MANTSDRPGFFRIRFRLRTLLFMTTLLAVILGFVGNLLIHIRRQSAIVAQITKVSGQASFQNHLARIYVGQSKWDEWSREKFGEHTFRHIKHVHLVSLQPRDEVLALLPQLSRLEALQVSGKSFTADNLRSIGQCRRLQILDLHLSGSESASIVELCRLPALRRLKLANFEAERLREIADLSQLESLTIHSRHTTPAVLAELKRLTNLKTLEIDGCVDSDHETCAALVGLDRLEELSLRNIPMNGRDFQQLAKLPNLRQLYMPEAENLDIESATALRQMTQLRRLSLYNYVNDESLAALAGMPELEWLQLHGADISDASVPALRQFPKLRDLFVNRTNLTSDGLMELARNGQLRQLGVDTGLLSSQQEQELLRRKPPVFVREQ